MAKRDNLAARWERALSRSKEPSIDEWVESFLEADPEGAGSENPDDLEYNVICELTTAIKDCEVGSIVFEWPNSTHGDGCDVTVYVLPRRTTVMVKSATYEHEGPPAAIYRGKSVNAMLSKASELLFNDSGDGQDGGRDFGEVQELEDGDEVNPDADGLYRGEKELSEAWKKAIG